MSLYSDAILFLCDKTAFLRYSVRINFSVLLVLTQVIVELENTRIAIPICFGDSLLCRQYICNVTPLSCRHTSFWN